MSEQTPSSNTPPGADAAGGEVKTAHEAAGGEMKTAPETSGGERKTTPQAAAEAESTAEPSSPEEENNVRRAATATETGHAGGGEPPVAGEKLTGSEINLDTLLKVPVSLAIEVGRTRMPLNELLKTHDGSVIELERQLNEPLDILVNGALIAHGVVVLAGDKFGIQITDIVSPQERVRNI